MDLDTKKPFCLTVLARTLVKPAKVMQLRRQLVRTLDRTTEVVTVDFKGKAILVTIIQQVGGVVISIQQQAVGVRVTIHNNMGSSEKERKNQQIVFHCSHQPFATIERKAFSLFFYSLLLT